MEKLRMQTGNRADENFKKLAELFPNAVTETIDENGEVVRAIDKDVLMQEINTKVVEGREERYQFTWPDKKKSVLLANAPINKTLRPCKEESVGKDGTKGGFDSENLYIEGDNLEVLKLLQETYLGKIKMIYIDPPYNTGNDFVYEDDFKQSIKEYSKRSGDYDDEGNRLVKNIDSNGRFHTDWLNMMYPRLKFAKNLLKNDGFIFISIDDHEVDNLIKISDEIFGESNRLAILVWKKKYTGGKGTSTFADYHEYILAYAKNINEIGEIAMARPENEKGKFIYRDEYVDTRGKYYTRPLKSNLDPRPTLVYPIELPDGSTCTTQWICAKETFIKMKEEGRIEFKSTKTSKYPVYKKFYEKDAGGTVKIPSFIEASNNNEAKEELKQLFNIVQTRDLPFQTPKPTGLLEIFVENFSSNNDIVLDFFSGSASTAHTVFKSNSKDGSNRTFIMIQLPENSDLRGNKFSNICEIGKERIRRAGVKIKEENPLTTQNLDIGFRVLKCDSSNMKDVFYSPEEYTPSMFDTISDNIKEDRTPYDLLFQVMLDLGVELSSSVEEILICNKKVFNVENGYLMACFDNEVNEETIIEVAKQKPYYFVMRDSSMSSDSVAVNFEQIFNTYSPETKRKVL